jgi:glycosyltransferase involved in cell wall biosynthesis
VVRYGGATDAIRYFPNWGEQIFDALPATITAENLPELPKGLRLVYTGNIGEAQDFGAVLDAAERLRDRIDIQWIIVGDGRMTDWVKAEMARRALTATVTMVPQQPLERMPAYFAAADLLFLALKADPVFEKTIPGKLQSYLAAGKPVLAMLDGQGANVLEESGAGLACPAGDSAAFAQAVAHFATLSVADRAGMGTNARRYYEAHFSREHVFDALEGWMQELAEKRSEP